MSAVREARGIDEDNHAYESEHESEHYLARGTHRVPQPLDGNEPQGRECDDQCGESRRHGLLGPGHGAVASADQQCADDRGFAPLAPRGRRGSAHPQPGIQHRAREAEAGTRVMTH